MLPEVLQAGWVFALVGCAAFLVYGAWLVWLFQSKTSIANQHTVARLALHDSLPRDDLLDQMKAAAVDSPRPQGVLTMASVRTAKPIRDGSRRVLVVEDNLDSLHSMSTLVKMMGHECQFAINGFAALEIARSFRPEIVLLDIGLPDFQGDQIARQLKWEPGLEATRIIAITALPEAERQRAIDAGCDEFHRKPLDPVVLEQLLAKPGFSQRAAA